MITIELETKNNKLEVVRYSEYFSQLSYQKNAGEQVKQAVDKFFEKVNSPKEDNEPQNMKSDIKIEYTNTDGKREMITKPFEELDSDFQKVVAKLIDLTEENLKSDNDNESVKSRALAELNKAYDVNFAKIVSQYPQAKRHSANHISLGDYLLRFDYKPQMNPILWFDWAEGRGRKDITNWADFGDLTLEFPAPKQTQKFKYEK